MSGNGWPSGEASQQRSHADLRTRTKTPDLMRRPRLLHWPATWPNLSPFFPVVKRRLLGKSTPPAYTVPGRGSWILKGSGARVGKWWGQLWQPPPRQWTSSQRSPSKLCVEPRSSHLLYSILLAFLNLGSVKKVVFFTNSQFTVVCHVSISFWKLSYPNKGPNSKIYEIIHSRMFSGPCPDFQLFWAISGIFVDFTSLVPYDFVGVQSPKTMWGLSRPAKFVT